MNRLAKWVIRLYPASWRARYGDEMDALLQDMGADARVVTNLLAGGVRMQLTGWIFPKLALALGFLGILLGFAASYLIPVEYASNAVLELRPSDPNAAYSDLQDQVQLIDKDVLNRTSLALIIPSVGLYTEERRHLPLEDIIDGMRKHIFVQVIAIPSSKRVAFLISFRYSNAAKAREATAALVTAFIDKFGIRQQTGTVPVLETLRILDPASQPVGPIKPNRYQVAGLGFFAGIVAAVFVSLVHRRWTPKTNIPLDAVNR